MKATRRVTLIHNPSAGRGEPARDELLRLLADAGFAASYCGDRDDWDAALADPGELIVVAGGDGTVSKVTARVAGRGVPIAVLPLGTANNVATMLGADAEDLAGAVESWKAFERVRCDLGVAEVGGVERRFLESAGCGLFAAAMERARKAAKARGEDEVADRRERLAADRRELAAALEACEPRARRILADGEDLSGEHLLVEAFDFGILGPRLRFAPDASASDGRLHLVLAAESDRAELAAHLERCARGEQSAPRFATHAARRVEIECEAGDLHVDGRNATRAKSWGSPKGRVTVTVRLEPGAVEFLRSPKP